MLTIASTRTSRTWRAARCSSGSGGGGDPYVGELYLRQQLAEGRHAQIIKASELADDAFVISIAGRRCPDGARRASRQHRTH
jgi:hypothetical protein